jgi:hypothetical protein
MSPSLQLIHLPQIRDALGFTENASVFRACKAFSIPVVTISRQTKGIRASDLDLLLSRASAVKESA